MIMASCVIQTFAYRIITESRSLRRCIKHERHTLDSNFS